jgi:hypothetical protein
VQDGTTGNSAVEVLLSEDSGEDSSPLQLILLTLLLPSDVSSVAITILLALSFSSKNSDNFARLMTSPTTFQIYQHAMLAYLKNPEKVKQNLMEDYVVILQKITSRDTGGVSSQIDSKLIETLHSHLLHMQKQKHEVTQEAAFLMSNIKSIISLIS